MALIPPVAFFITSILCSTVSFILNVRILSLHFNSRNKQTLHYAVLLQSVFLGVVFNISSLGYSGYCLILSDHSDWNPNIVFWLGNVTFASSLAIIVGNCCTAADRLLAMRAPLLYHVKYARPSQIISLCLTVLSLLLALLAHFTGFDGPLSSTPAFNMVVSADVLRRVSLAKNVFCCLSIVITVMFLIEAKKFLRKQQESYVTRSIKAANKVVLYQMTAELVITVLPNLILQPFTWMGILLTVIIGPFPVALCSAYTMVCAVLLTWKMKRLKSTNQTVVSIVSS